ncbi:thiol-disulfide oxidoreductase DCC family protein [Streptomyces sp. DSM 15324]|uniref:thiol-disulfide oxidoreductase DCC family protein n=1 Tax=Streptomyces sp. DSM 15324 TaxID=1739111 RepID=UPI00074B1D19|nr:DCC1-like thiol-disulfide oxidoreductase family protein [Streptomyces sp. DSM 15324]KUO14169.1 thiol-disulfide oxidoreductase [Streptomyces sp. DSM 15324]
MTHPGAPASAPPLRPGPVLAYDGDCGFCQTSIDRLRALAAPTVEAVPWQFLPSSVTSAHRERLEHEVLLLRSGTVLAGGADALARYTATSPSAAYRILAGVVRLPGIRSCARAVYRWVSVNRHRLPGGTPACAVPPRGK